MSETVPTNSSVKIQTKQDYVTALFLLMKTQAFESITVSDITRKAGYARRTFYRYFQSRKALLTFYIDQCTLDVLNELSNKKDQTLEEAIIIFFEFWLKEKNRLLLLQQRKQLNLFMESWQTRLLNQSRSSTRYDKQFIIGGLFTLLVAWVQAGAIQSPQEMATYSRIIKKNWFS